MYSDAGQKSRVLTTSPGSPYRSAMFYYYYDRIIVFRLYKAEYWLYKAEYWFYQVDCWPYKAEYWLYKHSIGSIKRSIGCSIKRGIGSIKQSVPIDALSPLERILH